MTYAQPARVALRHIIAERMADDPQAAARLLSRMDEAAALLGRFPRLGRSGKIPGTRELIVTGTRYLLVYRLRTASVEIIDVRHTSRKP